MKKHILLMLLFLASCATRSHEPSFVEQPVDTKNYRSDLAYCEKWAEPTRKEWAKRCASNGEMVLASRLIAELSSEDPRDKDPLRQTMPNNTGHRLSMCLKAKGYKVSLPTSGTTKVALRQ